MEPEFDDTSIFENKAGLAEVGAEITVASYNRICFQDLWTN